MLQPLIDPNWFLINLELIDSDYSLFYFQVNIF